MEQCLRLVVAEEVTAFKEFDQQTFTAQCELSEGILEVISQFRLFVFETIKFRFDVSSLDLQEELETNISSNGWSLRTFC